MKDMTKATYARLAATALGLAVFISAVMLQFDWFGEQASVEAHEIDRLFNVMIVLSSFVFSVVVVMMGYAIWKYRAKPGDESDGEPIHGNTRIEVIWTVIPTLIVIFSGIYAAVVLSDIEAEASDSMQVNVTAQQFAWRFDYPEQGVTSTELHAPVGTQLELHLNALDVIHSFWVPEWRIKRDLVPGSNLPGGEEIDDVARVTPDKEGSYSVICSELCGWGHSTMRAAAVVSSQAEFDAWAAEQKPIPEEGKVSTGAAGGNGAGSLAGDASS